MKTSSIVALMFLALVGSLMIGLMYAKSGPLAFGLECFAIGIILIAENVVSTIKKA